MKLFVICFLASLLVGQLGSLVIAQDAPYLHDIFLLLLFTHAVFLVMKRRRLVLPKLAVPILAFTAAGALSLILNAHRFDPQEVVRSSLYLVRWIFYAGLYVLVRQKLTAPSLWLGGLCGVGVGFALLGILQYVFYPDLRNLLYLGWDPHYYRLFSTLFDPNFMGILLVFGVLLSYYLWKTYGEHWFGLAVCIQFIALIMTFSRSTYLALVAGLAFLWLGGKQKARTIVWGILFILLIIVYVPKPGGDTLRLDRMVSTTSRIENWIYSVRLFIQSPLVGHGFNTLRLVGQQEESWMGDEVGIGSRAGAGIDSSILFVAATTGILGVASYGWFLIRAYSLGHAPKFFSLALMMRATLVAIFVHSMFSNSLFYPWAILWIWIIVGVVEGETNRDDIYRW